jgi:acetyltransferase-like isoleucine patch superfamily enzyme
MPAIREALHDVSTRWKLRRCAEVGRGVTVRGTVWIHGAGTIRLGERVVLDGRAAPIELHARRHGLIVLDDDVCVEGGASLEADREIRVGARARVGRFCKILDTHFHRISDRDRPPPSLPVIVEEDADLGVRAILLPGAHVGRAAVVGAGTVLSRRIPDHAVAAGQPATLRKASHG